LTPGGSVSTIGAVQDISKLVAPSLVLALALAPWLVLPARVLGQATPVPIRPPSTAPSRSTDLPPAATEPPAATAPRATAPPAAPPTVLPSRPTDERQPDEDEDDKPPPPPAPRSTGATTAARPTRTRRPTRTPRTTPTRSPTPPVAGGLRLSIMVKPSVLVFRERATFELELRNQAGVDLSDLTLDVAVPDVLLDFDVEVRVGETARAGALLRWYLPDLPRDSVTTLRLTGSVAHRGGGQTSLCVGPPSPLPPDLPTAEPAGSLVEEAPEALASGWTLILLGFAILGAWLGLQLRSQREPKAVGAHDASENEVD